MREDHEVNITGTPQEVYRECARLVGVLEAGESLEPVELASATAYFGYARQLSEAMFDSLMGIMRRHGMEPVELTPGPMDVIEHDIRIIEEE